jgi:hypothetical protein
VPEICGYRALGLAGQERYSLFVILLLYYGIVSTGEVSPDKRNGNTHKNVK